jgi:membrane-bound metal-dependent hydrolase YbcI (DUF457 family)
MANKNEHIRVGAIVGGACNFVWQISQLYASNDESQDFFSVLCKVNYWEVAGFAAIGGAVFGCLPDLLEPPNTPWHRGFFHSVGCGGALLYGAFGTHTETWELEDRMKIRSMALSYLSHLYLDSTTPMGLPLLGLRA